MWNSKGATRRLILVNGAGDDDFMASQTGTYTVLLGSSDASTGTVTVTASPAIDAGSIALGTPKAVTIGRPGQDTRLSYTGTAGQALGLDFTEYTFTHAPYLTLTAPDGTVLSAAQAEHHVNLPVLPTTGTYTITLSPYSTTGSTTIRLTTQPNTGAPITTGPGIQPRRGASGSSPQRAPVTPGSRCSVAGRRRCRHGRESRRCPASCVLWMAGRSVGSR